MPKLEVPTFKTPVDRIPLLRQILQPVNYARDFLRDPRVFRTVLVLLAIDFIILEVTNLMGGQNEAMCPLKGPLFKDIAYDLFNDYNATCREIPFGFSVYSPCPQGTKRMTFGVCIPAYEIRELNS